MCFAMVACMALGAVFAGGKTETSDLSKPKLLVSVWAGPHAICKKKSVPDLRRPSSPSMMLITAT
jgi:hypothetical protein